MWVLIESIVGCSVLDVESRVASQSEASGGYFVADFGQVPVELSIMCDDQCTAFLSTLNPFTPTDKNQLTRRLLTFDSTDRPFGQCNSIVTGLTVLY